MIIVHWNDPGEQWKLLKISLFLCLTPFEAAAVALLFTSSWTGFKILSIENFIKSKGCVCLWLVNQDFFWKKTKICHLCPTFLTLEGVVWRISQVWTPIKITLFQRDFIQSWARDELSGDRGAKQLEGTWRLLQPLSQEILACSTEGALLATI